MRQAVRVEVFLASRKGWSVGFRVQDLLFSLHCFACFGVRGRKLTRDHTQHPKPCPTKP